MIVKQATWGDDSSATDITNVVANQASSGYLDIVANESIVPFTSRLSGGVTISSDEKKGIRDAAVKSCGGGGSAACVNNLMASNTQQLMEKKLAENSKVANVIAGRKLTMTIIENGKERVITIPDGGKFTAGQKPLTAVAGPMISSAAKDTALGIITYLGVFARVLGPLLLFSAVRRLPWGLPAGTPFPSFPWAFLPGVDRRVNYAWIATAIAVLLSETTIGILKMFLPVFLASSVGWGMFIVNMILIVALSLLHRKLYPQI